MQQVRDILKPIAVYEAASKTFESNIDEYFGDLVKKSQINKNQNKETCDQYYAKVEEKEKTTKKQKGKKALKGFLIFLAIVFFAAMIAGILMLAIPSWKEAISLAISIPLLIGGALLGTGMVLIICLDLNKKIKQIEKIIQKQEEEIKKLETEAWNELEPLNNLFTWNIPQYLITQTCPLINLDRIFTPGRQVQLFQKYGYEGTDINSSVVSVQSGSILGNPFIFERVHMTWMGTQVYTGSITISWTTYTRDSNGHSVAQHHTQVLTASVTKPKPFYGYDTQLVYGNDAAPKLSFSRKATKENLSELSDKKIQRMVKKADKKLEKKARKSETFTKMGNSEFEALFNATDRDNEVEFRLLFTPIAQQNMLELLKAKPYGDDFDFYKMGPINIIRSAHSQGFDYHAAPSLFADFDYERMQSHFKEYCLQYFQSLYFDLAPILSIPLYQQYKAHEYIYKTSEGVTNYEIESIVNNYGAKHFCHPSTVTECILKCGKVESKAGLTSTNIQCLSYKTIEHVTVVQVYGGDGHMHGVPVTWYEYVPLSKITPIKVIDHQGYASEHKDQSVDTIYKKFGIKDVYGQKGISLHVGK